MASPTRNYRRRLWQGCLAGVFLGLIAPAGAQDPRAPPADRPEAAGVDVAVADGRLTLRADGAPLAEVLGAIGEAGSFRVVLRGSFAEPVHESFTDQPLADAIRRLTGGHSVLVLHGDPAASAAGDVSEIRVIESPAEAVAGHAGRVEDAGAVVEKTPEDDAGPPMDRETFRLLKQGLPPPTREDIASELGDPDPATRMAAVPKVGSLRPRAAIGVLAGVFAMEHDPLVRSRAVAALMRLDGPGSRRLLRERALADEDAGLRVQALNALARSDGERAITVLAQALRDDPERKVRISAVRALGRLDGERARRHLEHALSDPHPQIRGAAERALASRGSN